MDRSYSGMFLRRSRWFFLAFPVVLKFNAIDSSPNGWLEGVLVRSLLKYFIRAFRASPGVDDHLRSVKEEGDTPN